MICGVKLLIERIDVKRKKIVNHKSSISFRRIFILLILALVVICLFYLAITVESYFKKENYEEKNNISNMGNNSISPTNIQNKKELLDKCIIDTEEEYETKVNKIISEHNKKIEETCKNDSSDECYEKYIVPLLQLLGENNSELLLKKESSEKECFDSYDPSGLYLKEFNKADSSNYYTDIAGGDESLGDNYEEENYRYLNTGNSYYYDESVNDNYEEKVMADEEDEADNYRYLNTGTSYTDSLGNTYYYNNDGSFGTSRTNSLGITTYSDNQGYKATTHTNSFGYSTTTDNLGNTVNSYEDSIGIKHYSGSDGYSRTVFTDSLGSHYQENGKQVNCFTNSFGMTTCN